MVKTDRNRLFEEDEEVYYYHTLFANTISPFTLLLRKGEFPLVHDGVMVME